MSTTRTATKSPAAPSRSLEVCYSIASKIYDSYSHTEFGAPDITGAAKLSATSGPGKSLVSDLKQYGLVEKTKSGRFVISQALKDAHATEEGTSEFNAAMFEFVKKPQVFQRVILDAKGKLPSANALANNLRSTHQFNPEKAKSTARAICESLEWVGVLDPKGNIIESRLGKSSTSTGASDVLDALTPGEVDEMDNRTPASKLLVLDVPLADGRTVHVRYPYDLNADEATKIGRVLAAICG